MTLHVPFEHFAETAKRVLGTGEAYLHHSVNGTRATAVHPTQNKIVAAVSELPLADARKALEKGGLKVHDGSWANGEVSTAGDPEFIYVAAVSYLSGGEQAGIWVDAYSAPPTHVQVMKALYEEFRENGEMPEVSFEEFVRLAKPNVAIVSPSEISSFLEANQPGC